MSALGFLLNLVTDSDDFDGDILGDSSDISDDASDISDNASDISDDASDISDNASDISDNSSETTDNSPETSEASSNTPDEPSATDSTHQTTNDASNTPVDASQNTDNQEAPSQDFSALFSNISDDTLQTTDEPSADDTLPKTSNAPNDASNTSDDSSNATDEPFQPSEDASVTDTDEPSNTPDEPSNTPDEPSETTDNSSETTDASYQETNIIISPNKPKRSWIYIAIGILGVVIILSVISSLGDDNFVPDSNWREKITDNDTERCLNNIIRPIFDYKNINSYSTSKKEELARGYLSVTADVMKTILEHNKDANLLLILSGIASKKEEELYVKSKGLYKCDCEKFVDYKGFSEYKDSTGRGLFFLFKQFIYQNSNLNTQYQYNDIDFTTMSMYAYLTMLFTSYIAPPAPLESTEAKHVMATTPDNAPAGHNPPMPSPAPTPNNNASDTEKRCDTQTISKEKHLPKWNIEIVDSSVIASMLKDAEKNHLPFLKINASDNLKQKLETYILKFRTPKITA